MYTPLQALYDGHIVHDIIVAGGTDDQWDYQVMGICIHLQSFRVVIKARVSYYLQKTVYPSHYCNSDCHNLCTCYTV